MATTIPKKDLPYYLNLPWTFTIEQEPDEEYGKLFIVRVNELPGVVSDGATIEEAIHSVMEALKLSLRMSLEEGEVIPEPFHMEQCKGNIAYRTSSERHYFIAKEAKKRNLSLSQVIDSFIDTAAKTSKSSPIK